MGVRSEAPYRLVALVRPDQRAWLLQQVTPLRSQADVVRDLIDAAMLERSQCNS